jgi:hypothetical protein
MNIPVDLMVHIITNSTECSDYLTITYPYEFEIWTRFSKANGAHCSFARAAIKRIFQYELKKFGREFLGSLGSSTWGSAVYKTACDEQLSSGGGRRNGEEVF